MAEALSPISEIRLLVSRTGFVFKTGATATGRRRPLFLLFTGARARASQPLPPLRRSLSSRDAVPHPLPVGGGSPWSFFSLELGNAKHELLLPVIPLEASCG